MNQDKVSKLSDTEKNVWDEDKPSSKSPKPEYKPSYSERWSKIRPKKMVVFWICLATIILTIFVGFNWGGWVTAGTAQEMAESAVVQRLAPICVDQFNQDPEKDQKFTELKDTRSYQRDDYVKAQGWATLPGETEPNHQVADGCARLIVQANQ
jgi:hypothetical protein